MNEGSSTYNFMQQNDITTQRHRRPNYSNEDIIDDLQMYDDHSLKEDLDDNQIEAGELYLGESD